MDPRQLRRLLVLANPFKQGDLLVGGTRDDSQRAEARRELRATTIGAIDSTRLVDDGVSEALSRSVDREIQTAVAPLTIDALSHLLLADQGVHWVRRHRSGLTSEAIAAVVKVMTDQELSRLARALFNPLPGDGITIGSPQHFGSRIQPNSPGDTDDEILFSIFEGLTHGCGDVIIGLNPASDELDTIVRLEQLLGEVVHRLQLPTRFCVLSDLPKQHRARQRAHVDVGFQSLAGTSQALGGMVGLDVDGVLDLTRDFAGLYFETGQGSAVTNGAAAGVDMVTLESRTYGVARSIAERTGKWMIVNDVAGFIGPEVFNTPEQLERACLEDAAMAKLHGLTMGLDVCATFHMGIPPAILRQVTERIVSRAAPAYLMAVAGNADPMLGYLTTSFREHPKLRHASGRQITTAMQGRLSALPGASVATMYAIYAHASEDVGHAILQRLRDSGFDLGYGAHEAGAAEARVDAIYEHARLALYAVVDDSVLRDAVGDSVSVRTLANDRDDYLAHPPRGERLRDEDTVALSRVYSARRVPQVLVVVSDGLNANAINEQIRALLPAVRRLLADAGVHVGDVTVVITNGRVRAGYHVAQLIDPDVLVHLIGERPGTGLNTASAYLTYGRDAGGRSRWRPALDHSCTTAVCGIHRRGKPPEVAAAEIARAVVRMLETRRSGVDTEARKHRRIETRKPGKFS
jgi:ethanolamine ammonia-lyase large subunit